VLRKTVQSVLIIILILLNMGSTYSAEEVQQLTLREAQTRLSLPEAQEIALKQNPEVREAYLEIKKSESHLRSIIAQRYPQAFAAIFGGQQMTGNDWKDFVVVPGVYQPVTQQYRLGLMTREARIQVEVSRQRLRLAKQRTIANIRINYLSMLALQSSITSLQENLDFLGELERYVASEVRKGAALEVDALLVRARVARADFELAHAKDDLTTLMQTLNRMLGRAPRSEMVLVDQAPSPIVEGDEDTAIDGAFAKRPEMSEIKLNIRRYNLESRIQLAGYIPDVGIGILGAFSNNFDIGIPRNFASVGFLGTWTPWDSGTRMHLSREQQSAMRQEGVRLNDLANGVSIDVDKARRAVRVSEKEAKSGELAELSSKEELRVIHRRFTSGAALLKDVLEAHSAYMKAIADNVKAKTDIATAQAQLDEALGRDF